MISVGEFLGKPGGARPTVTAPQLFQAYMEFMFDTVHDRKSIATWLSKDRRQHSPKQLRANLATWAELIRVRPLHTDFWRDLLEGPAVRLAARPGRRISRSCSSPHRGSRSSRRLTSAR